VRDKITSLFLHPITGLTVLVVVVFISTFFVSIEEADPTLPEVDSPSDEGVAPTPGVKVQPIVVALERIPANTRITASAIGLRLFPEASDSPPEVLFTKQDVINKVAKFEIPPGQVILSSMLTTPYLWVQSVYPAMDGELIFYTHQNLLYAMNAKTGEELWYFQPRGEEDRPSLTSPPVADAGMVYYAIVYPDYLAGYTQTRLFGIDIQTGRPRWSFTHQDIADKGDNPPLPPVVAEGIVCFVGWGNKNLYAFDAEIGYKKWQFHSGELISSPGVANGIVSFMSSDGHLYGLDVQTGQEKWRVKQTQ
jgi:outer membrane protein assembly factor BamB